MDKMMNYIENTGPVTRVGVIHNDEETACRFAMDALSTETTPMHTDSYEWGWEVVFETVDL